VSFGVILVLVDVFFGFIPSLDQIFDVHVLSFTSLYNGITIIGISLSAISGAVVILNTVGKAKKVLDYSVTRFFVHFIICCVYDGFPLYWLWWVVHIVAVTLETLLGEYLCLRREHAELSKHTLISNV